MDDNTPAIDPIPHAIPGIDRVLLRDLFKRANTELVLKRCTNADPDLIDYVETVREGLRVLMHFTDRQRIN